MSYLDQLPNELLIEIFLYLDIEDLERTNPIIIESRVFWTRKLKNVNMEEYVSFLGLYKLINKIQGRNNCYLEDYSKFVNVKRKFHKISQMIRPQFFLYFNGPNDVLKKICNLDEKFSKNSCVDDIELCISNLIDSHTKIWKNNVVNISRNEKYYIETNSIIYYFDILKLPNILIIMLIIHEYSQK